MSSLAGQDINNHSDEHLDIKILFILQKLSKKSRSCEKVVPSLIQQFSFYSDVDEFEKSVDSRF